VHNYKYNKLQSKPKRTLTMILRKSLTGKLSYVLLTMMIYFQVMMTTLILQYSVSVY